MSAMPRLASSFTSPSRSHDHELGPGLARGALHGLETLVRGQLRRCARPGVDASSSARAAACSSLAVARFDTPKSPMATATATPSSTTTAGASGRSGHAPD